MKRIKCRGAAIEACVTRHGTIVAPLMTELVGFKELTPYKGGWCGNEIYDNRNEYVVLCSDFVDGSGLCPFRVDGIRIWGYDASSYAVYGLRVRLKETTRSIVNTSFDSSGWTQVWSGNSGTATNAWVTYDTTNYYWDSDNLGVDFVQDYSNHYNDGGTQYRTGLTNRMCYFSQNNGRGYPFDGSCTRTSYVPKTSIWGYFRKYTDVEPTANVGLDDVGEFSVANVSPVVRSVSDLSDPLAAGADVTFSVDWFDPELFDKVYDYGFDDWRDDSRYWDVNRDSLPGDWWDEAWGYRKSVVVDNSGNSDALTGWPVFVSVGFVAGKMNLDLSDLRFIDPDDNAVLSYWVEDANVRPDVNVWVKCYCCLSH